MNIMGLDEREELRWRHKRHELPYLDDPEHVWTSDELEMLDDYSSSIPSGVFVGKFWRRGEPYSNPTKWFLGEFVDIGDPKNLGINWRELHVADKRLDCLKQPTHQP